jgi:hypothetical protein
VSADNKRHAAVHEAAHAVVASSLGSELGGAIQGYVFTEATRYDLPMHRLEDAVVVALAGNIAEEMILGTIQRVPGITPEREDDERHLQWLFSVLCPWGSADIRERCEVRARDMVQAKREPINALAARLMSGEMIESYTASP